MVKRRYFIYLSYKGTSYHGWQVQPNGISVQELLEKTLSLVFRTETEVVGAGRTDAGVHAALMVAHFDTEHDLADGISLTAKLNSILPHDIAIFKIVPVRPDAHARFDAVSRRYEYHIITSKNVFQHGFATRFNQEIDFEKMNQAAKILFEFRDFTSFSKLHTDTLTNNCVIKHAEWTQRGDVWVFTIEADRFLRNMVRAIVGTLLEVGWGKMTLDDFKAVLLAKNRCKAGASVAAQGLYLVDVQYPHDIFIQK